MTQPSERALAPDLARGLMLLLIAVANVPWYLYGGDAATSMAHHLDATGGDRIWQLFSIVAIDGRAYPLFAFLFGYGIWQLYAKQTAAGTSPADAKRLLQRRHAWMIAFGAVHALLLWFGDVVGSYGLVGLIVVWLFLDRADRTLRIWAIVMAALLGIFALFSFFGGLMAQLFGGIAIPADLSVAGIPNYLESVVARLGMWALGVPAAVLSLTVPMLVIIALIAARHRVLEEPERHRGLLTKVAIGGIAIGWVGGGLTALNWVGVPGLPDWSFASWQYLTGAAGGLGYAALFALVAARIQRRGPGPITRALTATGRRSLTAYLLQSVILAPLFSAWGFGLGLWMGELAAAGIAAASWLVTVVVCVVLQHLGKRGPAEWLLRKLAYGSRRTIAPPTRVDDAATEVSVGAANDAQR